MILVSENLILANYIFFIYLSIQPLKIILF